MKKKWYSWCIQGIIFLGVLFQLYLFFQKENFHIDELFSFGLANGVNGVYFYKNPADIDNRFITGYQFSNFFTQQEGSSFSQMWKNMANDNHMPFYFILLRFVNSFFDPVFNIWPGIIVNIFALIGGLLGFYYLVRILFHDKAIALHSTALFMFCQSVLSLEVYIRMYLLQMTLAVWLLFFVCKFMSDKKVNPKNLGGVFIFAFLLILTHYYSLIFCFFTAVSGCLIFILQNKYQKLFGYGIVMILAVLAALCIYPQMITVGVSGERGGQFFDLVEMFVDNPVVFIFEKIVLFRETIAWGVVEFLILSIVLIYFKKKYNFLLSLNYFYPLFIGVIFVGYGLIVTLFMPVMQNFQIRYFAPIVPISLILWIYIFRLIFYRKISVCQFATFLWGLWLIKMFVAFWWQDSPFYMRGTRFSKRLENIMNGADVWWGFGGGQYGWMLHMYIDKLAKTDKVWILTDFDNIDFVKFSDEEVEHKKYAYLLMPKQQEKNPDGAIYWIKKTTGRQAYYLFTVKIENSAAMVMETSVFLVCPF